jgi:hypothetical protein
MKKKIRDEFYEFQSRPEDLRMFAKSVIYEDIKGIIEDWIEGSRNELEVLVLKFGDPETQRTAAAAGARIEVCRYFLNMFDSLIEDEQEEIEDAS